MASEIDGGADRAGVVRQIVQGVALEAEGGVMAFRAACDELPAGLAEKGGWVEGVAG